MSKPLTYADSGVNIQKANSLIKKIKSIAKTTPQKGVMSEIGGFGGLYSLNLINISNPVLVSSTDGVGTKLKIASMMNKHDTIGIDLVAMCVNDIIVQGAKPLFFLDYLATGKLDEKIMESIISGIAKGCNDANCSLLGGETAEMPGMYNDNEYDLAGFSVGIVDNDNIIDGSLIKAGCKLIGLASNGLHSNGFSLVRKVFFEKCKFNVNTKIKELDLTLGEELLKPTQIYVSEILSVLRNLPVHGIAHITGGGIDDNIMRILPKNLKAVINKDSWDIPPIFKIIQKEGNILDVEMHKTFNNGIGMILVVPEQYVQEIIDRLSSMNKTIYNIGEIQKRKENEALVQWV